MFRFVQPTRPGLTGRRMLRCGVSTLTRFFVLFVLFVVFGVVSVTTAAAAAPSAGGPDQFGYTYLDSNDPGGPAYGWKDISATGTLASGWTSYDDGYAGPFPLGFTFNYYGQDYTEVYIGSNGYLSFGM